MQTTVSKLGWVEVDLGAIRRNVERIKRFLSGPARVMCVIKANAYGHGAVPVAHTVLDAGAEWLAVARLDEGLELREAGIGAPVLVLGPVHAGGFEAAIRSRLSLAAMDTGYVRELAAVSRRLNIEARVHIKVDTGMGRLGLEAEQLDSLVEVLRESPQVQVEGVFTHLASADEVDRPYTLEQFRRFKSALRRIRTAGLPVGLAHISNSAGVLEFPELQMDMVRVGIMTYGLYPSPQTSRGLVLEPAMSLCAQLSFVKKVAAGTSISYGRTYVMEEAGYIGVVPVGYADGYSRQLGNKADVLIRGRRWPVVGRVCMDMLMVNLGQTGIQVGERVVLMGRQDDEEISASELATLSGTINYEVVSGISHRLPRYYRS